MVDTRYDVFAIFVDSHGFFRGLPFRSVRAIRPQENGLRRRSGRTRKESGQEDRKA